MISQEGVKKGEKLVVLKMLGWMSSCSCCWLMFLHSFLRCRTTISASVVRRGLLGLGGWHQQSSLPGRENKCTTDNNDTTKHTCTYFYKWKPIFSLWKKWTQKREYSFHSFFPSIFCLYTCFFWNIASWKEKKGENSRSFLCCAHEGLLEEFCRVS